MTTDEKYMKEALKQAKKAYALKEVPVGCVIVYEDQIIARGYNRRNTDQNTDLPRRDQCDPQSEQKAWRLATGRLHNLHHDEVAPDVRRGHRPVTHHPCGDRQYESESRLCRFRLKSP